MSKDVKKSIPEINYPKDFTIWETDIPESKRLQIIGDFPHRDSIIRSRGLNNNLLVNSFGITDEAEIKARQDLLWFLSQKPKLREWIKNVYVDTNLPTQQDDFLFFFNPEKDHNPYWQQVHNFISLFDAPEAPKRIKQLTNCLKNSLALEETENQMSRDLFQRIEKTAFLEGILTFGYNYGFSHYNCNQDINRIYGHCAFSSKLNRWRNILPRKLWRWIEGICNIYVVGRKQNQIMREMVINDWNSDIINDITKGLNSIVSAIKGFEDAIMLHNITFQVYFSYNGKKLEIRIYGANSRINYGVDDFNFAHFAGYSQKMEAQIKEARILYRETYNDYCRSLHVAEVIKNIKTVDAGFFKRLHTVSAPKMDKRYAWVDLEGLYKNEFSKVVKIIKEHRKFVDEHINCLKAVSEIASAYCNLSDEYGWPLCKPQIDSKENVVSARMAYPVYLLHNHNTNGKQIRPIINLPAINGTVIGVSGANNGGKTVTGLSFPELIFEAQSGLLSFGREVKINIKDVLAMIFIPSGADGSKCNMVLDQIKILLKEVKKYKSKKIFLFIDELGGGTQEISGKEFSLSFVQTLRKYKISTIFNSQITSLFEELENKGVQCFKINRRHIISVGIGTGQFEELVREKGIDKLLVNH